MWRAFCPWGRWSTPFSYSWTMTLQGQCPQGWTSKLSGLEAALWLWFSSLEEDDCGRTTYWGCVPPCANLWTVSRSWQDQCLLKSLGRWTLKFSRVFYPDFIPLLCFQMMLLLSQCSQVVCGLVELRFTWMWLAIFTDNISTEIFPPLLWQSWQFTSASYFLKIVFPCRFNCDRRGNPRASMSSLPMSNPSNFILNSDIVRFIPAFGMDGLWKTFQRVSCVPLLFYKMAQKCTWLGTELETAIAKQGAWHLCQCQ